MAGTPVPAGAEPLQNSHGAGGVLHRLEIPAAVEGTAAQRWKHMESHGG